MSTMTDWLQGTGSWAQALGTFVALGIAIWLPNRQNRKLAVEKQEDVDRRAQAHWEILGREIEYCVAKAQWYLGGHVAPLYRLDTPAFEKSLPSLVDAARPSADDFAALLAFYSWVGDINRGLDRAAAQSKDDTSTDESNRVKQKCTDLISEFYEPVRRVLHAHGVEARQPDVIKAAYARSQRYGL